MLFICLNVQLFFSSPIGAIPPALIEMLGSGAERLGKRFDVPVVMAKIRRVKRGYYETTFNLLAEHPNTLPNYAITDMFYEQLEALIKEDPSLYFWTHNRFKLMRQKQQ